MCLRSHGVATEFGRYLGAEERSALLRDLRAQLRRMPEFECAGYKN